jgi:hypothetical protein
MKSLIKNTRNPQSCFEKIKLNSTFEMNINLQLMKNILVSFIILSLSYSLEAQTTSCDTSSSFAQNAQFFFNSFQLGKVVFEDNSKTDALLNYNVVSNDMYYIEDNKYFSLSPDEVKMIMICNFRFFFEQGKIMELIYDKEVKIFIERTANLEEFFNQKGAYGATSPNAVGTKLLDFNFANLHDDRSYLVNLRDKGDKEISITKNYKIKVGTKNYPATQKSFLKIYKDKKEQLKVYFDENQFDFHKKEDLIKIANYCLSLK